MTSKWENSFSQICDFLVTSYSMTNDTVTCTAMLDNAEQFIAKHQRSLQYKILWENTAYKTTVTYNASRSYEYCGFRIRLNRNRTNHLINTYVPACLFVLVSWFSFLIKPDVVPGRMMLLVTIFLMLISILNESKSSAPAAINLNPIDLYLIVCIFHVFGALVEYAVILAVLRYLSNLESTNRISDGNGNDAN